MFITNIFERRLNANLRRHKLDAQVAPRNPKPNCRVPERRSSTLTPTSVGSGDAQLLDAFLVTAVDTIQSTAGGDVLSMSSNSSATSISTMSEQLSTPTSPVDAKKPLTVVTIVAPSVGDKQQMQLDAIKAKSGQHHATLVRTGSVESAVFTDSDLDAASNVSFVA